MSVYLVIWDHPCRFRKMAHVLKWNHLSFLYSFNLLHFLQIWLRNSEVVCQCNKISENVYILAMCYIKSIILWVNYRYIFCLFHFLLCFFKQGLTLTCSFLLSKPDLKHMSAMIHLLKGTVVTQHNENRVIKMVKPFLKHN